MRLQVQPLALLSGLGIQCCHEWWCRLAAAAPISLLAWEPPYAAGVALKKKKTNKTIKQKEGIEETGEHSATTFHQVVREGL